MFHLLSPLGLILYRKFGTRKPVVLGVVLVAGATVGTAVSSHLVMIVFFCLCGGLGASLCTLTPVFLLAEYFPYYHPHHVTATSIIFCGFSSGLYQYS